MTAYTLRLTDSGGYFRTTGSGPGSITVPADAGVPIPTRTHFRGRLSSAFPLTFVEDTGVTIHFAAGGGLTLAGEGLEWELIKVAVNAWDLHVTPGPRRDVAGPNLPHGYVLTKKGAVISRGGAGSWKEGLVELPQVFWDPRLGKYVMVFSGYSGTPTSPTVSAIGYATSDDLVTWAEFGSNPIFQRTSVGGDPDQNGVAYPFVWYEDGVYYLFYIGFTATGYAGGTKTICLATSTDFVTWTRHGTIIAPVALTWRATSVWHPHVVKRGDTYYLFFNAGTAGGIGYATSPDLLTWTVDDANSPVITDGVSGWDGDAVGDASLYRIGDTWYAAFFGLGSSLVQTGLAFTSDADFPLGWTKFAGNPVLPVGAGGAFDDSHAGRGGVLATSTKFYLWYTASDGATPPILSIALATDESQTPRLPVKVAGVTVESAPTSLDFEGGVISGVTDALGAVTLTVNTDTDGTLAANSDAKLATQKATKTYITSAIAAAVNGLSWKQEVRAATTATGTLSTAFANGQVIDGVTLATGDRILIKDQSTASQNGIYIVAASGAPSRALDADSGAELVNAACFVSEGTVNADAQFTCTTNAPITVGTTGLTFVQAGGGTTYAADGSTLQLVGTTFSVKSLGIDTAQLKAGAVTLAKIANAGANNRYLGAGSAGSGAAYTENTFSAGAGIIITPGPTGITIAGTGATIPTSGLIAPQGRLTLVTGTPVLNSDQTAKTHIYYTPYVGSTVPVYDGAAWGLQVLSGDLDLALDTSNHLANGVYDVFAWMNSGVLSIGAGPAWVKASTITVTIATPAVVTWTGHGLPEATSIVFTNSGGALPTGITAGTTYFVGRSPGTNTFNISTTLGNAAAGVFVATSGSQSGTHTATNHTLARGTGAGTTELELKNGIWTNKNSITLTNGAGAGTAGIAANTATYLGSFFATAPGQTGMMFAPAAASGGSNNVMALYNAYNRVKYQSLLLDNETTITYSTATWRALGGTATNRLTFLDGLQQSPITALYTMAFGNTTGQYRSGVNLDSTAATPAYATSGQATIATNSSLFSSPPQLGFHYIVPMEFTNSGTSSVFPSGLGGLTLTLDM